MPIVFVHGVNNRIEDADYEEGVARKTEFFKSLLAPRIGLDAQKVSISFPYWGGEGVKFRWNQASVPTGSEAVDARALGSPGGGSDNPEVWLGEARFQYGAQGVNLGQLSKTRGFTTAIDLVWDTASAVLQAGASEQGVSPEEPWLSALLPRAYCRPNRNSTKLFLGCSSHAFRPHRKSSHSDLIVIIVFDQTPLHRRLASGPSDGCLKGEIVSFAHSPKAQSFEEAFEAIDLGMSTFWFTRYPEILAKQLTPRIKLTAKRLGLAGGFQRCKAYEVIAQALRFDSWHALSSHLRTAEETPIEQLPPNWLDKFNAAGVLLIEAKGEVALPRSQIDAFERFAETVSMLTDVPKLVILDNVAAPLCAGKTWSEVRTRNPLQAQTRLYSFVMPDGEIADDRGGCFSQSPACEQLADHLDERWLSIEKPTKAQRSKARRWITKIMQAQPGFIEGGLALAWILYEEGDSEALVMVNRLVKQADSLIPKGYRGRIIWGHISNRFYHRLLWLQFKLNFQQGNLAVAAKLGRKMLRLNPNDNLGVRYVLPLILLECGNYPGAKRALKPVADESGLTVAAVRAFVHFALGDMEGFRQELALALFTLPILRAFLLDNADALPANDDGYRGTIPDIETFAMFAWPAYCAIPGLRAECHSFVQDPVVLAAERELFEYWKGYWPHDRQKMATRRGSFEGWKSLIDASVQRVSQH